MRIALISTCALSTPPRAYGGTELVVAELAKGLVSLGHDVTVYATGDSSSRGQLRWHFKQSVWPPNELAEARHAGFAWKDIASARERYDLVHVHHATALPFQPLVGLPTALTIHHARVDALVDHYRSYPQVAYVAISGRQAELTPELRFARTIHHGLDPELYPAGGGDGGYVAFLGRFAAEKAPHIAVDAARQAGVPLLLGGAAHEVPEAQAYFHGELEPRLHGASDVIWCGELPHEPKLGLLQQARALLVPLQWEEPFGLVMIEAMLVGTPVIAFARGSAPEIVEDGVTGYLVHSTEEMGERIRQLDRVDRARCRARAQERWSTTRMAQEYAALYSTMLRRSQRTAQSEVVSLQERRYGRAGEAQDGGGACAVAAAAGANHGTECGRF
jgi:glycosyltransferase involved in cell wall biosynthesis